MKNKAKIIYLFFSIFFILFPLIGLSQALNTNERQVFDGNESLDIYFSSVIGQDGLSWDTAYVFENQKFEDTMVFTDQGPDTLIKINNTDRCIIFRNCIFDSNKTQNGGLTTMGLDLDNATNILVTNCTFLYHRSLYFHDCSNVTVSNNTFYSGTISSTYSDHIVIENNSLTLDLSVIVNMRDYLNQRGYFGLYLFYTDNISVCQNTIIDYKTGIKFNHVTNSIVQNNTLIKTSFEWMSGVEIDDSNTVNGKKVYIYEGKNDLTIDNFTNAGQVILYNCSNSTVENVTTEYINKGIAIQRCSNITISNCSIKYPMEEGIEIICCNNSVIINNHVLGWAYNKDIYIILGNFAPKGIVLDFDCYMGVPPIDTTLYNINITENRVFGFSTGIKVRSTYEVSGTENQRISNIQVWNNYFSNNYINGLCDIHSWVSNPRDWICWDNNSIGNYWSDCEQNHDYQPIASSKVYESEYTKNGVVDQKPLKNYDLPIYYTSLSLPYVLPEEGGDNDNPIMWIVIGIVGGCIAVAITFLYLKKSGRIGNKMPVT